MFKTAIFAIDTGHRLNLAVGYFFFIKNISEPFTDFQQLTLQVTCFENVC